MPRSAEIDARWVRSMRTLKSVVQAGGFSAAEKITCTTTAQISRQISGFEEFLGYKLCTRGPQGFELTGRGKAILPRIYAALDALDNVTSIPSQDLSGEIRIGIVDNIITNPECYLSKAVELFVDEAPKVKIVIQTIAGSGIIKRLTDGNFHIAIAGTYNEAYSLNAAFLFNEYQKIYCHKSVSKQYKKLPFIINPASLALQAPNAQELVKEYKRGPEAFGLQSVAFLINSRKFIGMLPINLAEQLNTSLDIECVPDSKEYSIPFYAITYAGRALPLCAERFIKILIECHQPMQDRKL